ncbi:hypothetical protein JOB18_014169 [Solea senegalensis]|uniref:Uncharacterized protein n=1 Tax=Solea senegalensis TaxID=28829 RepID=A0AAV6RBN2_SOLSE|nr:hypothetical protein JOB18_014169 [Solea senegalensis]
MNDAELDRERNMYICLTEQDMPRENDSRPMLPKPLHSRGLYDKHDALIASDWTSVTVRKVQKSPIEMVPFKADL